MALLLGGMWFLCLLSCTVLESSLNPLESTSGCELTESSLNPVYFESTSNENGIKVDEIKFQALVRMHLWRGRWGGGGLNCLV